MIGIVNVTEHFWGFKKHQRLFRRNFDIIEMSVNVNYDIIKIVCRSKYFKITPKKGKPLPEYIITMRKQDRKILFFHWSVIKIQKVEPCKNEIKIDGRELKAIFNRKLVTI